MKNKLIAIAFALLFIVSGCYMKANNYPKLDESSALWMVDDEAKEITVEVRDIWHFYEEAAKAFEKKQV